MPGPDYPQAETDLHPQGTGTYQTGTAPKTLQQKAQEKAQAYRQYQMQSGKQKVSTFAPGDPSVKAKIAATPADKPVSFSDQD